MRFLRYSLYTFLLGSGLIISFLGQTGCKSAPTETPADSTSLISSDFFNVDTSTQNISIVEPPEEEQPKKKKSKREKQSSEFSENNSSSNNNSSNSSSEPRSPRPAREETIETEYARPDDSPQSMARAIQPHIIKMLYNESYNSPKTKILSKKETDNGWELELETQWADRWVRQPYSVKGLLKVGKDGSNPIYTINSKNAAAEALEFTHKDFKDKISLDKI
jgi:hypothetical protein